MILLRLHGDGSAIVRCKIGLTQNRAGVVGDICQRNGQFRSSGIIGQKDAFRTPFQTGQIVFGQIPSQNERSRRDNPGQTLIAPYPNAGLRIGERVNQHPAGGRQKTQSFALLLQACKLFTDGSALALEDASGGTFFGVGDAARKTHVQKIPPTLCPDNLTV